MYCAAIFIFCTVARTSGGLIVEVGVFLRKGKALFSSQSSLSLECLRPDQVQFSLAMTGYNFKRMYCCGNFDALVVLLSLAWIDALGEKFTRFSSTFAALG